MRVTWASKLRIPFCCIVHSNSKKEKLLIGILFMVLAVPVAPFSIITIEEGSTIAGATTQVALVLAAPQNAAASTIIFLITSINGMSTTCQSSLGTRRC